MPSRDRCWPTLIRFIGPQRVAMLCFVVALLSLSCARSAFATIQYQVSLGQPENHLFHVRMEIPDVAPGDRIAMPAWNALYQIGDFAYRVRDVEVGRVPPGQSNTERFEIARALDAQDWSLAVDGNAGNAAAREAEELVTYSVSWDEPGPFSSQLNDHHAFINLAEILMYLPDRRAEKTEVVFTDVPSGWNIIAELPHGPDADSFTASSYDALVDATRSF
jgi:predicted metalloprotease with PDZ domain